MDADKSDAEEAIKSAEDLIIGVQRLKSDINSDQLTEVLEYAEESLSDTLDGNGNPYANAFSIQAARELGEDNYL